MNISLYDNLSTLGIRRPAERSDPTQSRIPPPAPNERKIKRCKIIHEPASTLEEDSNRRTNPSPGPDALSLPPVLTHPATHATLQSQARLLHLLHARNKNQHRRGVWYRSFGVMRREVGRLCDDLGVRIGVPQEATATTTHQVPTEKKVGEKGWVSPGEEERTKQEVEGKVLARVKYWVDGGLVVRWFKAFTHLVGSTQFAPLGLSLLAILARICTITGCTAAYEANEQKFASPAEEEKDSKDDAGDVLDDDKDVGVVIERKIKI